MPFTNGHALLIGIGSYQHEQHLNIPITVKDALALSTVLRDSQYCGYPASQVTLLSNEDATQGGILNALDNLGERTTKEDTIILFYCGHGIMGEDDQYYLTSYDTRIVSRKVVKGTGVAHPDLLDKLRKIPAKRMLIILNACHAGAISPTLGPVADATVEPVLPEQVVTAMLATGEGRIIITACRENQVSFIGNGNLTIFGQALVTGLCGTGTSSKQGYITAFDLYTYLYNAVGEAVRQQISASLRKIYGEKQEPELTILKGVGPFAVALYRGSNPLGQFQEQERLPSKAAAREVSREVCQATFQQIQKAGINFGKRNTVAISGDIVSGSQRITNTGGGDYAEGDIDKRQGVIMSGGTIYGSVVGYNAGSVTTNYGNSLPSNDSHAINHALMHMQQAVELARQRNDEDLADDLEGVVRLIQAARKAKEEGKTERKLLKIHEAQEFLKRINLGPLGLEHLIQMLEQLTL